MGGENRGVLYLPHPTRGHCLANNACIEIERQLSKEIVCTSHRGWRIPEGRDPEDVGQVRAVLVGCSWAMGVGNMYENSIAGQLERELGGPIANLGVGSYSLLQVVLQLEEELAAGLSGPIILLYGSWLIDRSVKRPSFPIITRPIVVRGANGALAVVPARNLPPAPVAAYTRSFHRGWEGLAAVWLRRAIFAAAKLRDGYGIRGIARRAGLLRYQNLSWADDRAELIHFLLERLNAVLIRHGATIRIQHLFEYPNLGTKRWALIERDREILNQAQRQYDAIDYIAWDAIEDRVRRHMTEAGKEMADYVDTIHWADNSHPNATGSRLIAAGIAASFSGPPAACVSRAALP